ncbi:hypothetical protein BH09PSE6_BH09PSE6_31440 [soil metagenome]
MHLSFDHRRPRALAAALLACFAIEASAADRTISCEGKVELPNQEYTYSVKLGMSATRFVSLDWTTHNSIGGAPARQCAMQQSQISEQRQIGGKTYEANLIYLGKTGQILLKPTAPDRYRLSMPLRPDGWCGGTDGAVISVDIDFAKKSCELALSARAKAAAAKAHR